MLILTFLPKFYLFRKVKNSRKNPDIARAKYQIFLKLKLLILAAIKNVKAFVFKEFNILVFIHHK